MALAEKLRSTVEGHPWPHGLKVTLSGGVVQCAHQGLGELINAADQLLFQAKHKGRNRVEHILDAVPLTH